MGGNSPKVTVHLRDIIPTEIMNTIVLTTEGSLVSNGNIQEMA